MGTDYFYAIAVDLEKLELERLQKAQKDLADLLQGHDYPFDSGYFFIPFWHDEKSSSALELPLR